MSPVSPNLGCMYDSRLSVLESKAELLGIQGRLNSSAGTQILLRWCTWSYNATNHFSSPFRCNCYPWVSQQFYVLWFFLKGITYFNLTSIHCRKTRTAMHGNYHTLKEFLFFKSNLLLLEKSLEILKYRSYCTLCFLGTDFLHIGLFT